MSVLECVMQPGYETLRLINLTPPMKLLKASDSSVFTPMILHFRPVKYFCFLSKAQIANIGLHKIPLQFLKA